MRFASQACFVSHNNPIFACPFELRIPLVLRCGTTISSVARWFSGEIAKQTLPKSFCAQRLQAHPISPSPSSSTPPGTWCHGVLQSDTSGSDQYHISRMTSHEGIAETGTSSHDRYSIPISKSARRLASFGTKDHILRLRSTAVTA